METDATRLHEELYSFRDSHLHPALRGQDPNAVRREFAEQIHALPLLSKAFCSMLIEEAERRALWEAGLKVNFFEPDDSFAPANPPANGLSLKHFPGLTETYNAIIDHAVAPIIESLWETFELRMYRTPYLAKFSASDPAFPPGTAPDWAQCGVSMRVALDDDYDGGGLRFRQWGFESGRLPVGTALIFPGGISHEHEELPLSRGVRRVLVCEFF
jgi:hypothetical protein